MKNLAIFILLGVVASILVPKQPQGVILTVCLCLLAVLFGLVKII